MVETEVSDEVQGGGWLLVEVIRDGKNGPEVIERVEVHNLVVNAGKRQAWRTLMGLNSHVWNYMRIGSCAAAPASGQTNLVSPITNTLRTVDSKTMVGSGLRTAKIIVSYPSGAGSKSVAGIKEACLLNSHTTPGGSALMRAILPNTINKTTQDKVKLTYQARWS